jgi:BirA family biotin operon repressor/biotin-[acetyl-CoA-carboxylase] ligase
VTLVAAMPVLRRQERFASVTSTNDVVRAWLAAGEPEICLAIADEQTAGRGRNGRTWTAPPGAGLLLSLGHRPTWLAPERVWQLAATTSVAMANAIEAVTGLEFTSVLLKWPNDLVMHVDADGQSIVPAGPRPDFRKLAGVLGETEGLGTDNPRVVIGIGLNADWPAATFPPDLAAGMTSLRAATGDRPIDVERLLETFLVELGVGIQALHDGRFATIGWVGRQATTGRILDLVLPDGTIERVSGRGVDPVTGALRIVDPVTGRNERAVYVGEITHVRLAEV